MCVYIYNIYIYVSRPRKGNYTATPQGFVYSFVSRDTSCTHKTPQDPDPSRFGWGTSLVGLQTSIPILGSEIMLNHHFHV